MVELVLVLVLDKEKEKEEEGEDLQSERADVVVADLRRVVS